MYDATFQGTFHEQVVRAVSTWDEVDLFYSSSRFTTRWKDPNTELERFVVYFMDSKQYARQFLGSPWRVYISHPNKVFYTDALYDSALCFLSKPLGAHRLPFDVIIDVAREGCPAAIRYRLSL